MSQPAKNSTPSFALRLIPLMDASNRSIKAIFFRFFSWPLSLIYRLAIWIRNSRFDSARTQCYQSTVPIVSVGNLTTGGTGKTPLVRWVCRNIRDRLGKRVGLLSRGYRKGDQGLNDEALELEWSLPDVPHLQDPDRSQMAEIAIEEFESECLVLDDAFQHRKVLRDLDIVVIDATNPFGFGHCLPRGLLREPVAGLGRAQAVVISRCDQVPEEDLKVIRSTIQKYCQENTVIALAVHKPVGLLDYKGRSKPLSELSGLRVVSFCGIGNPDSFFSTLNSCGVDIAAKKVFPDHHQYQREDIQGLEDWAESYLDESADGDSDLEKKPCQEFGIVTTVKDLVKVAVPVIGSTPLWAVEIQLQFLEGESELLELVEKAVSS